MRFALIPPIAALIALASTASAIAAGAPAEITKCQACHGADGNSSSGDIPRLNGQSWVYIANRVRSFRDLTRQSTHAYPMFSVNSSVNDATLLSLAHYFASQPPTAAASAGALADQGRQLYRNGDGKTISACLGCHGVAGEGQGATPRLNGQHAIYLRRQLDSFSMLTRVNETMNPHARNMSSEQITALVAYLAKD